MLPYLIFFAIAAFPALFYTARINPVAWAIVWLLFVIFIGLRHEVGGDWDGYLIITQSVNDSGFLESLKDQEVMFSLLTWLSTRFGTGVYGVNLIGAAIFCSGLFAYCRTQKNAWLALASAVPFLVVVAAMSANRQGMALGIVLFVMSRWSRLGVVRRSVGIAIAALFHSSAALLLLMSVADLKVSRWKKAVLSLIAVMGSFWLVSLSEATFARYTQTYVEQPEGVYSPGAIFHLLLNLVPALIMLASRERWRRTLDNWSMIQQLCLMAVGLMLLAPFFTVAVGRMSLYLFPISIAFISSLPDMVASPRGRGLVRTTLVLLLGSVLVVWLAFSNTAFTYLPYRNVLTIHPSELVLPQ